MRYAGFWKRFVANVVDGLVMLPLGLLFLYLGSRSRTAEIALTLPSTLVGFAYNTLLLGRFGQTLGKRAAGIEVRRADGGRIEWSNAWRRSAVEFVFAAVLAWLSIAFLLRTSDAEYDAQGWWKIQVALGTWAPYLMATRALMAWSYSELLVVLLNRRRRALHDFIAGTVVVGREQ